MTIYTTKELRRQIIRQRISQSTKKSQFCSDVIINKLIKNPVFIRSNRIAMYLPAKGEVNPVGLLSKTLGMQKNYFLPILHPFKHNCLWFAAYQPGDSLIQNRYGIWEPIINLSHIVPAWSLDLVITPLVAFDEQKNRLGMGGGFYDRTFAFLQQKIFHQRPKLVGVAFEFQKVPALHANPWDIPLTLIITEECVYE